MHTAFKILGMSLLFASCTAFGIYKSALLKERYKRLDKICRCMDELYSRILHTSGELDGVMYASFGDSADNLIEKEKSSGILKREETELLREFLSALGCGDTKSECSRILLYKSLFESHRDSAYGDCDSGCKLWRTAGICTGIAVCIFLM